MSLCASHPEIMVSKSLNIEQTMQEYVQTSCTPCKSRRIPFRSSRRCSKFSWYLQQHVFHPFNLHTHQDFNPLNVLNLHEALENLILNSYRTPSATPLCVSAYLLALNQKRPQRTTGLLPRYLQKYSEGLPMRNY